MAEVQFQRARGERDEIPSFGAQAPLLAEVLDLAGLFACRIAGQRNSQGEIVWVTACR